MPEPESSVQGVRSDGSFSIGSDCWPGVSKLLEEMGELQQVLGKLIATHGTPDHWDGSDLIERLADELADVEAALRFVKDANAERLDRESIDLRADEKTWQFRHWHAIRETP